MNFYKRLSDSMKFVFVFLAISIPMTAHGLSPSTVHSIKVDPSGKSISVNLMNADISDVAQMLSKEAGIKVLLDQSIADQKITSKFEDVPIESGVKRILGSQISSAFIFSKEKGPSGEETFHLDMVRIFKSGDMLGANFREFDKGTASETGKAGKSASVSAQGSDSEAGAEPGNRPAKPQSRRDRLQQYISARSKGAIAHEINLARKNLDIIRKRNRAQVDRAKRNIASLRMKLSQNPSPDARAALVKELSKAEQDLSRIKTANTRLLMDEERNLREMNEGISEIDSRERFIQRQRDAVRQRRAKENEK